MPQSEKKSKDFVSRNLTLKSLSVLFLMLLLGFWARREAGTEEVSLMLVFIALWDPAAEMYRVVQREGAGGTT